MHDNRNLQDKIDFEVVNTYLQQSRLAIFVAWLLMLFLAISYYQIAPLSNILIWATLITLPYAYTFVTAQQFKPDLPEYQMSFFRKRQHFLHILSGFLWGSAYYLLLDAHHPKLTDFRLAAAVGIVIAFAASTMAASMRGLVGFVLPLSFLSALFFLSNFDYYRWWFAGLLGLDAASLFFGWKVNQYIQEQIESRLLNQAYIDELRVLNDKVEHTNQDFIKRNLELQDMQKLLELQASHDALTGLYNRRYVLERINEKLPEIRRHQLNFCLMMMDIDHFKSVNDEFGHAAGDDVLRQDRTMNRRL